MENFDSRKSDTSNRLTDKFDRIKHLHGIDYSNNERAAFDKWIENQKPTSLEAPHIIKEIGEVEKLLPSVPNYTDQRAGIYFKKPNLTEEELNEVFDRFRRQNPDFEIAISLYGGQIFFLEIGGKTGGVGPSSGRYYGHYHPTLKFPNAKLLPRAFTMGLMPSAGDLRGFITKPFAIEKGTRIFSKNGSVDIIPTRDFMRATAEGSDELKKVLQEFASCYFDLFLGENNLNLHSDGEVAKFFLDKFGLELKFHYDATSEA